MSTAISNPLVRLVLIYFLSVFFHFIIPKRLKEYAIPFAFALIIVEQNVMPFFGGGAHFLFVAIYWISIAIVLDGVKFRDLGENKVFLSFCIFWIYYIITGFWSDNNRYYAIMYLLNTLIELLLVGYFAGIWVMRTQGGLYRLVKYTMILSIFTFLTYVKFGFAGAVDNAGRAMLSEEIVAQGLGHNVNDIGLAIVPIMAFAFVAAFDTRLMKPAKWFTLFSFFVLLCSAYFVMRTGSRNAALAYLPCAMYMLSKLKERGRDSVRIVAFMTIMAFAVVAYKFAHSANALRVFDYFGGTSNVSNINLDDVSSGRISIFMNYLRDMSGIDYLIGKGPYVYVNIEGAKMVGGAMSVYVTLVRDVGAIGLFLLLVHFCVVLCWTRRNKLLGQIVLLIFLCWALTGIAEQVGIVRGKLICLVQGFAYALCTRRYRMMDIFCFVPQYYDPMYLAASNFYNPMGRR